MTNKPKPISIEKSSLGDTQVNAKQDIHFGPSESVKISKIFDLMPSAVTHHDADGRIIYASEAAQQILGLNLDLILGQKITDLPLNLVNMTGQNLSVEQCPPEVALRTGEVISDVIVGFNHPESKKKRWLLVTAMPVFLPEESKPYQAFCLLRDITETQLSDKRIEEHLHSLQEFVRSLDVYKLEQESSDAVFHKIVRFLPNILTQPEITQARILIDDQRFTAENFVETENRITADIQCKYLNVGKVEFHYQGDPSGSMMSALIDSDHVLLDALAESLGLVTQIVEQNKEIESLKEEYISAYDRTIEAWSALIDAQDKEASGHTMRVTELALELSKELGFEGEDLHHIRRGALIHDIGKLSVPDEIILKPGKLTDDEFQVIKNHPVIAKKWLSKIELLKPALQIPYLHHERWDGTGYPQGLAGEEIPLVARMFAVVDVWDALISDRPFRSAMSKTEALDLILSESGNHFDPDVVESFLTVLSRGNYIDTSYEIKVQAFRQARVWLQNRQITSKDWQVSAARDLFFLLIAFPDGLSKEQVGLHMWPDFSNEELDVRFKNTLYRLRQAVGNNVILFANNRYRFNKILDYVYDVEDFKARIETAQTETDASKKIPHLVKAVQLYDGEYLPEVDEIWAMGDRERFRQMYLGALLQLAELYYEQQDLKSALHYVRQALGEDCVLEEAHRLAMRIHAEAGNQAEVVRQFEACRSALVERFNLPPTSKTIELYEKLIQS